MDEKISTRIQELVKFGERVVGTMYGDGYPQWVDMTLFYEFKASSVSFLRTVFKTDHPIYNEFVKGCDSSTSRDAEKGLAILRAAKSEIDGGWLTTVKDLLSAEIFSDFLEMAEYLLNQKYKDASAVIIGSVLEEHLRNLCIKKEIPTETEKDGKKDYKKADRLNQDLYSSTIYNKLDNKNITSWLDLRNKAAHGQYEEYNFDQVKMMFSGVLEFTSRVR